MDVRKYKGVEVLIRTTYLEETFECRISNEEDDSELEMRAAEEF